MPGTNTARARAKLTKSKAATLHIKVVTAEEAQAAFHGLVGHVATGQVVVVQGAGERVVALINADDYEAVLESLEDLRDAKRAREILDEVRSGKIETIPWEQVKAELRAQNLLDD
jgi:prevent-host-death family protein